MFTELFRFWRGPVTDFWCLELGTGRLVAKELTSLTVVYISCKKEKA